MRTKPKTTRKQVTVPVDDDADDDLELETAAADQEEVDLDEELRSLDEELGADASTAKIVVHKIVPNGESQRCFACPRPQFFSDLIREQWGAGTYSLMVYHRGRLKARHRLTFAEPLARPSAPAPATPAATPGATDLEARLEARFEREQSRMFELMKMLSGRGQSDPLQMQQQILGMLATVKELAGTKDGGNGSSDRSAIDLVLEGVKLAQRLGGNGAGGEGTNWGEVILGVADGVRTIVETHRTAPRAALPRATSAAPATTPAADPAAADPVADPAADLHTHGGEDDMQEQLRKGLQFLVRKAAAKKEPSLYADLAIDNLEELPPFVQPIVLMYLQREDCLERLIAIEPAVANHREWFGELVAEIRRHLSPQNGDEPLTGETEGGNAAH